jgi:DNA-binding IclR family transcriptional regulator
MLRILDLFEERNEGWSAEELHEELGYSRSTLYRYLKLLTDAGLLASLPGIGYALGPRVIELDYLIRTGDPLIRSARAPMQELVAEFPGVALLCRLYRNRVLCVHQESSTETVHSRFERGFARPLTRGAASLAILANLPAHRLHRLYRDMAGDFAEAGLGESLAEVKAALKAHRQRGWVETSGQVTPGVTGVAAPIFDAGNEVVGSLSLTSSSESLGPDRIEKIAATVTVCARIVSSSLRSAAAAETGEEEPA